MHARSNHCQNRHRPVVLIGPTVTQMKGDLRGREVAVTTAMENVYEMLIKNFNLKVTVAKTGRENQGRISI